METNKQLKEEYLKTFFTSGDEEQADFWLSKLDQTLKSQRNSFVEKIEKFEEEETDSKDCDYQSYVLGSQYAISRILSLIKQDK